MNLVTSYITVSKLHRTYGSGTTAVHALRGLSLLIEPLEIVTVTGPSGSGKTTLLNCLLGLDRADAGTIQVGETRVSDLDYEQAVAWRALDTAVVFQDAGLLPHLSARENADIALRIRKVARAERFARIDEAFEQMQIDDVADHRPDELSGGQQQRVSLARALALRPKLLIADEPTGELDSETTMTVLNSVRSVATQHAITMVIATHDADVQTIADRTIHIVDGVVTT